MRIWQIILFIFVSGISIIRLRMKTVNKEWRDIHGGEGNTGITVKVFC